MTYRLIGSSCARSTRTHENVERTRGISQPYHAWRDGFDVKVELQLRLQQTLDASTR